ncbi:hypothetical protein BDEG_23368 [Batrachochytrium dendrobatidis JEL423]|nr:hypothetical protein BDEG_23368 [Batrachochytrium dendrobatidis JEL423]
MTVTIPYYTSDGVTSSGQLQVVNTPDTIGLVKTFNFTKIGRPWVGSVSWDGAVVTLLGTLSSDKNIQVYSFSIPYGDERSRRFSVTAKATPANSTAQIESSNQGVEYDRRVSFGAALADSAITRVGSVSSTQEPSASQTVSSALPGSSATVSSSSETENNSVNKPQQQQYGNSNGSQQLTLPLIVIIACAVGLVVVVLGAVMWRNHKRRQPKLNPSQNSYANLNGVDYAGAGTTMSQVDSEKALVFERAPIPRLAHKSNGVSPAFASTGRVTTSEAARSTNSPNPFDEDTDDRNSAIATAIFAFGSIPPPNYPPPSHLAGLRSSSFSSHPISSPPSSARSHQLSIVSPQFELPAIDETILNQPWEWGPDQNAVIGKEFDDNKSANSKRV